MVKLEVKTVFWTFLILGLGFTVGSQLVITSGLNYGVPKSNLIAYGIILLILAFLVKNEKVNLKSESFLKLFFTLVIGTLLLDYLWHRFFTRPDLISALTIFYWLAKFWIILYLSIRISGKSPITNKDILIHSLYFTGLLAIYYRLYEIIGIFPWGKVAGNIMLGSTLITPDNLLLFSGTWLVAHSLVAAIPLLLWRKYGG